MIRMRVGILTYKRPAELARALPNVLSHVRSLERDNPDVNVDVLVVDNDPAASAEATVRGFHEAKLSYVCEPTPGIAAARNRVLDECVDAGLLVYIDDDERPEDLWLQPLLDTWRDSGAAAVMGRVVSEFESTPDPWVAAGTFFQRQRMPTGTRIPVAATGNLLLDLSQVRQSGVRFNEKFGLTGGEDSLFTRELIRQGHEIVWCDESVATDFVPTERLQRAWVLKRAWSHGNTATLVELQLARSSPVKAWVRIRAVGRGSARVVFGMARHTAGQLTGSLRHQARGFRTLYRGAGMLAGGFGHVYVEYARTEAPNEARQQL